MSDRRSAIPPTASKVEGVNKPSSAAIRGAQHTFNTRPNTTTSASQAPKPLLSTGARSAAAAAGSTRNAAVPSISGQNATNTTAASFAAYARGRPPPGSEKPLSNAGLLFGPALSPKGQPRAQQGASPEGSSSQIAARMASKSRSPARRMPYSEKPSDRPALPLDQSAILAGKLASLRSHQNASSSSPHSQTSTPPAEQPALNLKQIPFLPKKPPPQPLPDQSAGKLAGAAAAQAAVRHAQSHMQAVSPRLETSREYFPFITTESSSPDRLNLGGSHEAMSTKSILSPTESEQNSTFEDHHQHTTNGLQKSTPIAIHSIPRASPVPVSGSNSAHPVNHRTGMTEKTLADAIVASSLASSRAPSPTKVGGSLNSPRRARSQSHSSLPHLPHHFLHHEKFPELSTKTSHAAARTLKQTLRKHSDHKEDDEEETMKRGRKHFMRKHPHKHHEGDRKRWRDKVTERERRRYEGVWAANRGLFVFWEEDPEFGGESWKRAPEADLVVNVVVRDVWERSHLPKDVLEEIWDLVATSEDAQALQRDQFVIGLWLIDQRLKGRKLPLRVSSDVWNSVRHPQGVKVSRKPF